MSNTPLAAKGSPMSEATKDLKEQGAAPPVRIFLQWNGDQEPDPTETPSLEDVTWCAARVFQHDVEYIRADRVQIAMTLIDRCGLPHEKANECADELMRALFGCKQNDRTERQPPRTAEGVAVADNQPKTEKLGGCSLQ